MDLQTTTLNLTITNASTEKVLGESLYAAAEFLMNEQDFESGFNLLKIAAKHGNASAQSRLGSLYLLEGGYKQDYKKALKWISKAAKQKVPSSLYELGMIYLLELGVPEDTEKGEKFIKEAHEHGCEEATNLLIEMEVLDAPFVPYKL